MLLSNQGPSEEFPSQGLLFTNMVGNKVNHGDEVGGHQMPLLQSTILSACLEWIGHRTN